ncbi:hypothetical protein BYT27DRAFT_7192178 [Phlegmacium glaucopus]|nr:hypothetical protein BYT27DRAFT_7192178 [Phlegmacium glaucopus]
MVQGILKRRQQSFMIGSEEQSKILEAELGVEGTKSADARWRIRKDASLSRLSQQRTSAIARLESDEYRNAYHKDVNTLWRESDWVTAPVRDFQDEFQSFEKRFSDTIAKASDKATTATGSSDRDKSSLAIAQRRCQARWEALRYRRQVEQEHADELDKIKKEIFDKLEGQGDSEEKARDSITSMVRVMISKYTRFLDISDKLLAQIGDLDILLDLIRYNEVITVVTVSTSLMPRIEQKIVNTVVQMPKVTHYGGQMGPTLPALSPETVSKRLEEGRTIITYNNVIVTDAYRPGNPYLLFYEPGLSFCTVKFQVSSQSPATKVFLLSHSGTRVSSGNPTTIRVILSVKGPGDASIIRFDQVYSKHLNPDNFAQQWIQIGNLGKGQYELKIELAMGSIAVYWLDYIELADFDESSHWRLQYQELNHD